MQASDPQVEIKSTITVNNGYGKEEHFPAIWLNFLRRLYALPDGIHGVVVVKSGSECHWSVQTSGKTEG